jgi:hypothetical protein
MKILTKRGLLFLCTIFLCFALSNCNKRCYCELDRLALMSEVLIEGNMAFENIYNGFHYGEFENDKFRNYVQENPSLFLEGGEFYECAKITAKKLSVISTLSFNSEAADMAYECGRLNQDSPIKINEAIYNANLVANETKRLCSELLWLSEALKFGAEGDWSFYNQKPSQHRATWRQTLISLFAMDPQMVEEWQIFTQREVESLKNYTSYVLALACIN